MPVHIDESAGRGPAAATGHRGHRIPLGEQSHHQVQPQLGPPLRIGYGELGPEQPGEGAFPGTHPPAEFRQRPDGFQIFLDQGAGPPEAFVAGDR